MKTAKTPGDIPKGQHYAIITFKSTSVHVPGDERSRTNPGHGYPERTETYDHHEYSFTQNRDEWIKEIQHREKEKAHPRGWGGPDPYVAMEVAGKAEIELNIVVGVTK